MPIVDAASLLLMRPGDDGPELLIVERHTRLAFGGGAYAFPGGRLDPNDLARGASFPAITDAALRIAALRETAEETGIDLGVGLSSLEPMTLFARWSPPIDVPRRFDTRFYLVEATPGLEPPRADGGEIVAAFWARPQTILDRCRNGDGRALFPTRRLLERMARFASFTEARDEALALPQRTIGAYRETRADGDWLCIPEGLGYPVTAERIDDAIRS